jgi:hypothetical protein
MENIWDFVTPQTKKPTVSGAKRKLQVFRMLSENGFKKKEKYEIFKKNEDL